MHFDVALQQGVSQDILSSIHRSLINMSQCVTRPTACRNSIARILRRMPQLHACLSVTSKSSDTAPRVYVTFKWVKRAVIVLKPLFSDQRTVSACMYQRHIQYISHTSHERIRRYAVAQLEPAAIHTTRFFNSQVVDGIGTV
jgi:hypothetical protein